MDDLSLLLRSDDDYRVAMRQIIHIAQDDCDYIIEIKRAKNKRTLKQNGSIHLYCSILSETFNAMGLDQKAVLKPGTPIPWDERSVKEKIWRKVQIALTGKKSTKDLDTTEVSKVYEAVSRHLAEVFCVNVDFPSVNHERI